MRALRPRLSLLGLLLLGACGDDAATTPPPVSAAGSAGTAGSGVSGKGGSGAAGGKAGGSGVDGGSGAGAIGGGSGTSGSGGSAGAAGKGGTGGSAAGNAGSAGDGGAAGTTTGGASGSGGGGAGTGGTAGSSGVSGGGGSAGAAGGASLVQTFAFDANIAEHDPPVVSELSLAIDSKGREHIAWISDDGTSQDLFYTVVDGTTVKTVPVVQTPVAAERSPSLVLDDQDHPHIAFFLKRVVDGPVKSGNYAVSYAGDPEGDGTFSTTQISPNVVDPNSNAEDAQNAYVNGRPQISIAASGELLVTYLRASNGKNGSQYAAVVARAPLAQGTGWKLQSTPDIKATIGAQNAFALPFRSRASEEIAWIDIGDYNPRFFSRSGASYVDTIIPGFAGTFANKHAQLANDAEGGLHVMWRHADTDTKERYLAHGLIVGTAATSIEKIPVSKAFTSNYAPAAVDPASKKVFFLYQQDNASTSVFVGKNAAGTYAEIPFDDQNTLIWGWRALDARAGKITAALAGQKKIHLFRTADTAF